MRRLYCQLSIRITIRILPPDQHDEIWAVQQPLNFPLTVYGIDRSELSMEKVTAQMAHALASHREDTAME